MSPHLSADYPALLADIKQRVRHAQTRAMLAVNAELIRLYWDIGALIDQRQKREGWGAAVIPRLAKDLHNELPEEKGFSERNIKRMLAFYREYPSLAATAGSTEKVPQAVAQLAPAKKCHRLWHKAARRRGWRQMAHRCLLLMFCCPCRGATMPN
nr:DUF1016 N-terminal domain-containing protein [Delftia acidovorans]